MSKIELAPNPPREEAQAKTITKVFGSSGFIYEHFHRVFGEEVVGTVGEPVGFDANQATPHYEEA